MHQTAIGIDDSDDNAAPANSGSNDCDDLGKWRPFFKHDQQPMTWDCDDFLDVVSEELMIGTLIGTIRKLTMNTPRILFCC